MKKDFIIHTDEEICEIRKAARVAAEIRDKLAKFAIHGMSTRQLDSIAGAMFSSYGGKSAFLGYRGFPGQICISINDEVVHGVPKDDKFLKNGDLLSMDIGINLNGYIGDTAISLVIGNPNPNGELKRLLSTTEKALWAGISAAKPGNYVSHISQAIEKVAKSEQLGVVRDYVGHGCGIELHEPPEIPNFTGLKKGPKLQLGMVLAIEPMFNLGTYAVFTDSDGWTVRTKDAKLSAHFEHMILITNNEPEVLTWLKT